MTGSAIQYIRAPPEVRGHYINKIEQKVRVLRAMRDATVNGVKPFPRRGCKERLVRVRCGNCPTFDPVTTVTAASRPHLPPTQLPKPRPCGWTRSAFRFKFGRSVDRT